MTTDLLQALANYIQILAEASEQTHRAEDRPRYTAHLAAAAQMFVAAYQDSKMLQKLLEDERRAHGWSYLADEAGARAERAFNEFATCVERQATKISGDQQS
jgi:hypothetical protein